MIADTICNHTVPGWQNQGYAWYIVPRTYTEKVGLIDWRIEGKRGRRERKRKKEKRKEKKEKKREKKRKEREKREKRKKKESSKEEGGRGGMIDLRVAELID